MKQLLIIPKINDIQQSLELAERYSLGFEYNDFFAPSVLDSERLTNEIIDRYKKHSLPHFTTIHGAFFDVIPFSPDDRIREISLLRIEQSISAAKRINAGAVVFHTNYNPFLSSKAYDLEWVIQNADIWSAILHKHSDINIYLENMFDKSPEILCRLSEKLCAYSNYGVCLDYAHAALSDVAAQMWAEMLGGYIKHIHLNDNDLKSDLHLAWGDGLIDRDTFYNCYEKHLNGASVLIEVSDTDKQNRSVMRLVKDGFIRTEVK
ncbi:MAG: hypothetical protein E7478_01735 [Ruminococcaceae bacterium]|nr:hypothetical protein [Oscillospiraceae bacterium]